MRRWIAPRVAYAPTLPRSAKDPAAVQSIRAVDRTERSDTDIQGGVQHHAHVYRNHDVNQRERREYYDQSPTGFNLNVCETKSRATTYGELPRIPVTLFRASVRLIRMAIARAAVVKVILTKRKSWCIVSGIHRASSKDTHYQRNIGVR